MPKAICTDSLNAYPVPQFTLIPLHHYTHTSKRKARDKDGQRVWLTVKDGKRPRDKSWTTADYNSRRVLAECIADSTNVGVRLKPDQLVLDIDPRNGGDEGFANFCEELDLDPSGFPTVITGSGGRHLYMSKPAELLTMDTLEGFPGVEFKSKGRQVVAAGSVHPDTLEHYRWDDDAPSIEDGLPPAPANLLKIIERPARAATIKGGGQLSQEQVAEWLSKLEPENFRDHAKWLRCMMAAHHGSNGDARHEFIEWSTRDPSYADDAEIIGRRWDSLHMNRDGGEVVTYRTLLNFIREEGDGTVDYVDEEERAEDLAAFDEVNEADEGTKAPWEEEFEGLDAAKARDATRKPKPKSKLPGGEDVDDGVLKENPGGFTDESTALLEKLNQEFATISDAGKFKIIYQVFEPQLARSAWERMSPSDFMLRFSNQRVERDAEELAKLSRGASPTAPLGKAWIEWAQRRDYKGLLFDPRGVDHPGWLNIWTGFAMGTGSPNGSWKYLNELIFDVLAEGNEEYYAYILNWIRFLFQHPEQHAEAAIVFRGGKGVGKGTLGNTLVKMIGRHALGIRSNLLFTGRFNAHFRDLLFLFADEAIKPHDKDGESQLKGLITEPEIAIEGKNENVKPVRNYLHVMMASNEHWVVPASADERRYFVTDCTTKFQRNEPWFDRLYDELKKDDGSGYKRFLWDMLKTPLPAKFHPRYFPLTGALLHQKVFSLPVLSQFFFNALNDDFVPFRPCKGDWRKGRVRLFVEEFRNSFSQWQRENGINPNGMGRGNMRNVFRDIQTLFPSAKTELREPVTDEWLEVVQAAPSDHRAKAIELPSMTECREFFRDQLGGDCFGAYTPDFDFG
jgi:hypothetical protein